jgi:hypothetical protein
MTAQNSNVPTGEDYLVKILSITKKETENLKGIATVLTYQVMEGNCRREKIVDYLNFFHESRHAKKIAYTKAYYICRVLDLDRSGYHITEIPNEIIGKVMIIHMDMELGMNTVSRNGYRPVSDHHTMYNHGGLKPQEELVKELTAPSQGEYMIIRLHGNSRRINFLPEDTEEERKEKINVAIRELDYVTLEVGGN